MSVVAEELITINENANFVNVERNPVYDRAESIGRRTKRSKVAL